VPTAKDPAQLERAIAVMALMTVMMVVFMVVRGFSTIGSNVGHFN
jgi:hypothetical protein